MEMIIGNKYNWKNQAERLVYLGQDGSWHQFALIEKPEVVWCELLTSSLKYLEEAKV